MPILKIFTCIGQHRIYQLSDTSLYQRLSRNFKRPLHPWTELWENNNDNNNNNNTNINGSTHSDQGYLIRTTKRFAPQMSCILCKKKNHKTQKNNKKKVQVIFLPDSEAPLCFPCNFKKVSYTIHIYTRSGWHVLLIRESLCMF